MKNKETEEQSLLAITHPAKLLQIVACPGSGKTFNLIHRIQYFIEQGDKPGKILSLTFTRKAAQEIRARLSSTIGSTKSKAVWIGTFHSIALRILKKYGPKGFKVCNEEDSVRIIRKYLESQNLLTVIAAPLYIKICDRKRQACLPECNIQGAEIYISELLVEEVESYYKEYLKSNNLKDYEDLIVDTVYLLRNNPKVSDILGFQSVFLDEAQDTDLLQLEILQRLLTSDTKLTVVLDPDQSIYEWRGANPEISLKLEEYFRGIETISLDYNHRCSGHITNASSHLISKNSHRIVHNITTLNPPGIPISICSFETKYQEADWVAKEISQNRKKGIPHSDICILYRNNYQGTTIEEGLVARKIPYKLSGADCTFFNRPEVRDALLYLRYINTPEDTKLIKSILAKKDTREDGVRILGKLKKIKSQSETLYLEELITQVLDIGTVHYHIGVLGASVAVPSLATLVELAKTFEGTAEDTLPQLLQHIEEINDEEDRVELRTIHTAKGCEWDTVFITGVNDGVLPDHRALDNREIEAERRLLYVAITRAKNNLYISYPTQRSNGLGGLKYVAPSQFLQEIPNEYIVRSR